MYSLFTIIDIYSDAFQCHPKFTHQPNYTFIICCLKHFSGAADPPITRPAFLKFFLTSALLVPQSSSAAWIQDTPYNPLSLTLHNPKSFTDRMQRALQCVSRHPPWPSHMPLLQNYYGHTLLTAYESMFASVLKLAGDSCQLEYVRYKWCRNSYKYRYIILYFSCFLHNR